MEKQCWEEWEGEGKGVRKKREEELIKGIEGMMDVEDEEYVRLWKGGIVMGWRGEYMQKVVGKGKLKG